MNDLETISQGSPWMTARECAAYLKTSPKIVYREAAAKRLKVAVVGGRRSLRIRREWADAYLESCANSPELAR